MSKTYRRYSPEQQLLLPQNLKDWLPEDHLAYFVADVVDHLDLSAIERYYEREERGYPPYHPRMMTKVLVYAYCVGVYSSRKIQKRLIEDVAFRVLAAGNQPDFRTISDFRKIHLRALQGLFEEVLQLALESGTMRLGRVALDGTKVQANASKHKAMSYGRMKEKELQLQQEVSRMLAEAEAIDADEDARYGKDKRGDELPEELRRRETRLAKIRQAKQALEERARRQAQEAGQSEQEAKPADKDQYNFTDPESRIMHDKGGFVQGYNAQVAVEATFQLIVGQTVSPQPNDKQQLEPVLEAVEQQSGQRPEQILADSGYCSERNLEYLQQKNIDGYVATEKEKHGKGFGACKRGPLPQGATRTERMKRKLQTKTGGAVDAARKTIVEPALGQIKQVRGFRQFLLRGLAKVQGEWALVCMTHNILKMYRVCNGLYPMP